MRVCAERVYGIPPEQVVGTAGEKKFGYDKTGKPELTKMPTLRLDDKVGKPEGIHLMIGQRPHAAFGNSIGDKEMRVYRCGQRSPADDAWCTTTTRRASSPTGRIQGRHVPGHADGGGEAAWLDGRSA